MTFLRPLLPALALSISLGSYLVVAQQQPPPPPMSFFVAGLSNGDGANLDGLAGADALCQARATTAGRGGVTWRAYLSTQGPGAVNARDRIGSDPWHNARGTLVAANQAELHGDTIEMGRVGNRINKSSARTEKGEIVNGLNDTPNLHDMLTGSMSDGRAFTDGTDRTCHNYTSNAHDGGPVQVGHHDKNGGANGSWNSVHEVQGCSQANLVAEGALSLYCFAPGN